MGENLVESNHTKITISLDISKNPFFRFQCSAENTSDTFVQKEQRVHT